MAQNDLDLGSFSENVQLKIGSALSFYLPLLTCLFYLSTCVHRRPRPYFTFRERPAKSLTSWAHFYRRVKVVKLVKPASLTKFAHLSFSTCPPGPNKKGFSLVLKNVQPKIRNRLSGEKIEKTRDISSQPAGRSILIVRKNLAKNRPSRDRFRVDSTSKNFILTN